MKKIYYLAAALLLTSVVGCQQEEMQSNEPQNVAIETVYATFDEWGGVDTRTSLNEEKKVLWTEEDLISVFGGTTANNSFILSKGAGTTYGEFRVHGLSAGTESADEISSLSSIVAFYPYDKSVTVSESKVYTINATFPAIQTYTASGTFGNGAAPAVAVTSGIFDANLKFKNVGAVLRVKLKGDATITKVVFSANADLAGKCKITASNTTVPTVEVTEGSQTVTINCGEGVKLSDTATEFVITTLPVAGFEGGMTISFYDNEGKKMVYTHGAEKTIVIERSKSYYIPVPEEMYAPNQEAEIVVKTAEELYAIAEQVNSGTDYFEGKTIVLANDIDLAGKEWTPIGSAAKDHGFMGNFDGKGYTIKNLTIENITPDSDGYAYAGLFGVTEGIDKDNQNYIKNLTIENVTISTTGHIASAAIAYPYYTVVENITVKGDIKIEGGDYTAGVLAYTRRCVAASNLAIEGNEGSSITGGQVVGGVISDIQMNGGLTADYSGFSASGLTISAENKVGGISGIISNQTLDGATVKNVVLSGDAQVGVVSGAFGDVSTIKNVVTENVTGASDVIGATYKTNNPVQAKVGDTYYATLVDALATGESSDITLLYPVTVAAGEEVTLDLNGRTVSHEKKCTESYQMIANKGTLTITGNGKISFKDTGAGDPNFGWGSYTIHNSGDLTIEDAVIEHLGEQVFAKHMICAIFQYSGSTTINGGTISTPNYRSVRLWKGDMTINGGEFDGQLWVQAVDNSAALTINGGTFGPNGQDGSSVYVENTTYKVALAVNGGTFTTKIGCAVPTKEGVKGSVKGGVFTESAKNNTNSALIAEGSEFTKTSDGNWTLGKLVEVNGSTYTISTAEGMCWFAEQVNSGAEYFEGKTIVLANDIDLKGQEWTPIGSAAKDHGFMGNFDGKGYTIKNLTIENIALDSDGYAYAGLFGVTEGIDKDNQNYIKDFTIENVTISTTGHIASAAIAYPYYTVVENIKVTGDVNIKGGNYTAGVLAYTRRCVDAKDLEIAGNSGSSITGGQTVGGVISDIQMNGGLTANYSNFKASGLTIKGNKAVGGISGIICKQTLDGATVENVVLNGTSQVGIVSGSLGDVSVIKNITTNNVTGATDVIGGAYSEGNLVEARVGDTYYATFAEALAKVQAGEAITLLHDINSSERLIINKDITLDGNGKKLNSTADRAFQITGGTVIINDLTVNMPENTAEGNRGINIYNGETNQPIDVTLNGVTVNGYKAYAVNIGGGRDNKLTINGSTLTGYAAINVHTSSVNHTIKVDDSTLNGRNHNDKYHFGTVVIDGDNTHSLVITNTTVTKENLEGVTSNYYEVLVGANCAYQVPEGIEVAVRNVYNETDGLYYIGLEGAVKADAKLKLLGNVKLNAPVTIGKDVTVTLDLNGKTISQEKAQTAAYGMIVNKGTLTIKDNVGGGKISYADVTAYTADVNYASNTITNYGTLNIESGIVENVTDDSVMNHSYPHAIDAYPGSTTNVKGGTVKSVNYDCIRLFCNSTTSATTVNISGGKIINRVSFQNPSSNAAGYGRLNITGGEFTTVGGVNANIRLLNFSQDVTNMKAEISGGTFDKGVKTQNYGSWTADWSWLTISNITINKL